MNSPPDMIPVGQVLPCPVHPSSPCSSPRWPMLVEGCPGSALPKVAGPAEVPQLSGEAHSSPQPSEQVSSQCSFLSYFISPPKSVTFLASSRPPPTKRWFLCLPWVLSAAAKIPVHIPISSPASLCAFVFEGGSLMWCL